MRKIYCALRRAAALHIMTILNCRDEGMQRAFLRFGERRKAVAQFERICRQIVILFGAVLVFDIDPARASHGLIARRIAVPAAVAVRARASMPGTAALSENVSLEIHRVRILIVPDHRAVMFDQRDGSPLWNVLSIKQRQQAAAINVTCRSHTGDVLECGTQVDVLSYLVDSPARTNARTGHDQWHMDVRVEGRLLARQQPMIAHVVAVIGTENKNGVICFAGLCQRGQKVADHFVDRLYCLGATAKFPVDTDNVAVRQIRDVFQPWRGARIGRDSERRRLRRSQTEKGVGVSRRRRRRPVWRERRNFKHEWRVARLLDELHCLR